MSDAGISPEEVALQTAALESVAADLHRDHTERQKSDRRAGWALIAAIALGVVDLVGVGLLWANFSNVNQSLTKLDRIESISDQTRRVAVQLECAIDSARNHPEWSAAGAQPGELESFDACVADGLRDADTDVLGPYPIQRVKNRVPGIAGPAARYGETMVIEGRLCNRTSKVVPVKTTLTWQAVGHTGTFITVARDVSQTRKPGCENFTGANAFHNPMPDEVVKASKAIGSSVEWTITGYEIPLLADGTEGQREVFTSELFVVVP